MMNTEQELFSRHRGVGNGSAIFLILLGLVSFFLPLITGLGAMIVLGVIVAAAGLAYGGLALSQRRGGAVLWRLIASLAFGFAGITLITHPVASLESLTLVLAISFFVEAFAEVGMYFTMRHLPGSPWLLLNAGVAFLLAVLIWRTFPYSATWAIGTLVGVNLLTSGFAPGMMSYRR
jgi:uncharacterized membrane protein HdeD (DUF308 family)